MHVEIDIHPPNDAVRNWALKNGRYVAQYGQIPWEIQNAFQAALKQDLEEAAQRFVTKWADIYSTVHVS